MAKATDKQTNVTASDEKLPKLMEKHKRFCEEYIIDLNQVQAYIRAGYNVNYGTAAANSTRLLKDAKIRAYIDHLKKERGVRTRATADRVLEELAVIGFSRITDYTRISDKKVKVEDASGKKNKTVTVRTMEVFCTEDIPDDKIGAIKSIKQMKDGTIEVQLHDKQGALEDMAKHLGMFNEDGGKEMKLKVIIKNSK